MLAGNFLHVLQVALASPLSALNKFSHGAQIMISKIETIFY